MPPKFQSLAGAIGVFAAVAETGSFTAAADTLGMSSPGVSRAIARLESRLGMRLFQRTTRSVSLTDEGRRLYDEVVPHLAGLEEAAGSVSGDPRALSGRLRVNLDPVLYRAILCPALDAFLDAHPGLELEFIARDSLGDLVFDGFDLAIRFGEPRPSSLVARKLLETPVITVASPAYLAQRGRPEHPQALEDPRHRGLEFRDPRNGRPFAWEFHRAGERLVVTPHGPLTLNDPGALMQGCLAGLGIAQMLALAARDAVAAGQLVQVLQEWPDERFPLYAYYPSRAHLPARTRVFLEFIVDLLGAH